MPRLLSLAVLLTTVASSPGCIPKSGPTSQILANGNARGQFKGFAAVSAYVTERLIGPATGFKRPIALEKYVNYERNLTQLLGAYTTIGGSATYRNGTPNALNMALWETIFRGFGSDAATLCAGPDAAAFNGTPDFAKALASICKWPSAEAKSDGATHALWQVVMGYQAPADEYAAWREWFTAEASHYAQARPSDAVAGMLTAAMMNPYFLLTE